jgi:hypothetical protein
MNAGEVYTLGQNSFQNCVQGNLRTKGEHFDAEEFILTLMCTWRMGSRRYTRDFDVVTIDIEAFVSVAPRFVSRRVRNRFQVSVVRT